MSSDEQAPASGSVPVAFGNALAWHWTRKQMSTYLRRSGLPLLLCQLRNFANAAGEVAFSSDRKPIRITDIAAASCCREKDARRYLEAAIRAGVVRVLGERKRGTATRYVIVPHPFPDWQAAEDYLKSTGRTPGKKAAPWSEDGESSGHRGPNHIGPPRPELTDGNENEVRATAARMGSGHRGPTGSGHRGPNNPGVNQVSSHDGAEVGFQPQVVGGSASEIDHQEHHHHDTAPAADPGNYETWPRCPVCRHRVLPDPRRPGRTVHARCEPLLATTDHGRHTA